MSAPPLGERARGNAPRKRSKKSARGVFPFASSAATREDFAIPRSGQHLLRKCPTRVHSSCQFSAGRSVTRRQSRDIPWQDTDQKIETGHRSNGETRLDREDRGRSGTARLSAPSSQG